ncbi:MAG: fibronectin type III domain-containing protein [Treponema sp.]|jgi:hypothetical protein|nr:fibronectin type III domain-containing protein [Treponema sp.]
MMNTLVPRREVRRTIALCGFCLLCAAPVFGAEKILTLGAASGWAAVEKRTQVEEMAAIRPHAVLALSSAWTGDLGAGAARAGNGEAADEVMALYAAWRNFPERESAVDLAVSFDEGRPDRFADSRGRYLVGVRGPVQAAAGRWARYGPGAALFTGETAPGDGVRAAPSSAGALFAPGRSVRDFSLEFWVYPNTMENGEQILAWSAADNQRILCEAVRNRLRWTFQHFFSPPEELIPGGRAGTDRNGPGQARVRPRLHITLESRASLVPRTWSHHLIRYNAGTGLLEYLVNGKIENMAYTTGSGGEGGDVFTPRINRDGAFVLGGRFSGMLDEFRLYNRAVAAPGRTALEQRSRTALELPELAKFPRGGGRVETRTLDLGERGSSVLRLEASGGRLAPGQGRMAVRNNYAGRGNFRFADDSAMQFFIRAGEEPYRFNQIPWTPVTPGEAAPPAIRGRYVQVAAAFYPSGDCETSPYLEELRIVYDSNEAPWPPSLVIARALDGAVELSWRPSPDEDVRGYLVFYGTSSGVYYGEGAAGGRSPIDAGSRTSLRIEGLRNGTLYFFAVAAYDGAGPRPEDFHEGTFSKEVTARPLRTGAER